MSGDSWGRLYRHAIKAQGDLHDVQHGTRHRHRPKAVRAVTEGRVFFGTRHVVKYGRIGPGCMYVLSR